MCSKEEYLKRYLSDGSGDKKKKRRVEKSSRVKILDDDIDVKSLIPKNIKNTIDEDIGADKPLVADFVDERPKEVIELEKFRQSSCWKIVGQSDNLQSPRADNEKKSGSQLSGRSLRHDSDSDSDAGGGVNTRHDSDSDAYVNRASINHERHDSDSDLSPPSRRVDKSPEFFNSKSHARQHHRSDTDSDLSPERDVHIKRDCQSLDKSSTLLKSGHRSDSDLSPERLDSRSVRSHQSVSESSSHRGRSHQSHIDRQDSDGDLSPKRKRPIVSHDRSPPKRPSNGTYGRHVDDQDLSPVRKSVSDRQNGTEKATKTLAGAKAGLQSASDMKIEAKELKKKEELAFAKISDEFSGRNAATVLRDKSTGRRRNLAEEQAVKDKEEAIKNVAAAKYEEWNKGLKQKELKEAMLADAIHEVDKPLARYRDDSDLDARLREQERAEDPMLAYIKKKKAKTLGPVKPRYTGPEPPPNRFNIWPGYRWDGVDRSNGFERQYFASLSNKKAIKDMAYKWSVEDM